MRTRSDGELPSPAKAPLPALVGRPDVAGFGGASPITAQVLALQRSAGNAAVAGLIQREVDEPAALGRNLAPAFAQAGVRVPRARQEAVGLAAGGQASAADVVAVAQQVLRDVEQWRGTIDERALRRLETDWGAELGWGMVGLAWDVGGLFVDVNPIAKAVYSVVDLAVTAVGIAADITEAEVNAAVVGAGVEARALAVTAQDEIVQAIMARQTSAVSAFNAVYGQLLATTDPSAAGAYGLALRQAGREHHQLRDAPPRVGAGDVEDVEASGLGLLDVADRADALLAKLRQAHTVLSQAPERIRRGGTQRLLQAQVRFAQTPDRVQLSGQLVRQGPDARVLRVDPSIGAGAHQTALSARSTWRDFEELRVPVDLGLELRMPFLEAQVLAAPEWQILSSGLQATVHLDAEGLIRWGGEADAGTIGMLLVRDIEAFGVGELRPRYGGRGTPPATTAADRSAGRALQDQVADVLLATPLGALRNARL